MNNITKSENCTIENHNSIHMFFVVFKIFHANNILKYKATVQK